MVLTWNKTPSRDISYFTLELDEKNRAHRQNTIPKAERRTIFDDQIKKINQLNGHQKNDENEKSAQNKKQIITEKNITNIKGGRRGGMVNRGGKVRIAGFPYYGPSSGRRMSLADQAANMSIKIMGMRSNQPRCLSPFYYRGKDVREYTLNSQFSQPIGPGDYDDSYGGEYCIGPLSRVLSSQKPSRDPDRPSRVFLSPQRNTYPGNSPNADYYAPTAHQYKHWTNKGMAVQADDRIISPETWGASYRNPRDPRSVPDAFYTSPVNKQGSRAEIGGNLDDKRPNTAFKTTEPRIATLPNERTADVRLVQGRLGIDRMYASGQLGPGEYMYDHGLPHSKEGSQPRSQSAPNLNKLKVPLRIRRLPYTNQKKYLRVIKDIRDTRLKFRLQEVINQQEQQSMDNKQDLLQNLLVKAH